MITIKNTRERLTDIIQDLTEIRGRLKDSPELPSNGRCVRKINEALYALHMASIHLPPELPGVKAGESEDLKSNALLVFTTDPKIRAWLEVNDPKSLEQAEQALRK
jgi:hypothetical protein